MALYETSQNLDSTELGHVVNKIYAGDVSDEVTIQKLDKKNYWVRKK